MEEEEAQVPAKGWKRCGSKDLAGDRQNRRMPETLETPHPLQLRLPTSSTSWLPDPSKRTSPPSSPPPPLSPHRTATSTTTTATPTTTPNVPTPASTSQKDILKTSQERSKEAGSQIGREKGEKGDQEFVKEAPQRAVKTLFKQQPSPPQQHKEIPEPEKEHGEKVDVDHQRVLEERRGSLIPFKKRLPRIHRLCKDPESIKELQILVKKLKKRKSHKLEVRDKHGLSPLHAAIEGNNFAAVRILLKAKVDINACDRNGTDPDPLFRSFLICFSRSFYNTDWTALHMACHNGELDIVEILLTDPTADRDVRSLDHSTPLHYIVRHDPPPGQEERYSLILQQLLGKEGRVRCCVCVLCYIVLKPVFHIRCTGR